MIKWIYSQLNYRHVVNGEKLVIAIAQDQETGEVLMVAYMNHEAFMKTVETGKAHYWSTSRNQLWLKGESSGHVQEVSEIFTDCDQDSVLLKVKQIGRHAMKDITLVFSGKYLIRMDLNLK